MFELISTYYKFMDMPTNDALNNYIVYQFAKKRGSKVLMSGIGGGQNFAPTTIVNSAPASTTMIASSSSLNPVSQKYFRSD